MATGGCFHDTTFSVTVNPTPTLNISGPATICSGAPTTLTGGGAATYTWTPANSLSASTGISVTASPSVTLTYTLNGSSAAGCPGAPLTEVVTVNYVPSSVTAFATNTVVCSGNPINLLGSATNATGYSWSGPNGFSSGSQNPNINSAPVIASGTYSLTASNTCGAGTIGTVIVTVNASPTLTATTAPNSDTICQGSCVTITVTGSGVASYFWSSGQTTSTANVCPANTSTYTVTATSGNGCKDSTFDTITVNLCLGIAPISKVTSANVYPNPNSGVFYVTTQNVTGNTAIEVYNILGEKVFAQTLSANSDESRIDMSDKPAGIYFYRIYSDKGTAIANGRFILK